MMVRTISISQQGHCYLRPRFEMLVDLSIVVLSSSDYAVEIISRPIAVLTSSLTSPQKLEYSDVEFIIGATTGLQQAIKTLHSIHNTLCMY